MDVYTYHRQVDAYKERKEKEKKKRKKETGKFWLSWGTHRMGLLLARLRVGQVQEVEWHW